MPVFRRAFSSSRLKGLHKKLSAPASNPAVISSLESLFVRIMMNIYSGDVILQNVTSFEPSPDAGNDYTKFTTTKGKGILNSNNGMIINGTFTEIRNIGTLENPVFYTELFVNEASLYIVIIYNAMGKILFRSAYTEEEYEKVICDE